MTPEQKLETWQALMNESEVLLNAIERHELWPEAVEHTPHREHSAVMTRQAATKARAAFQLILDHGLSPQHGDDLDSVIPEMLGNIATLRGILEDLDASKSQQPKTLN